MVLQQSARDIAVGTASGQHLQSLNRAVSDVKGSIDQVSATLPRKLREDGKKVADELDKMMGSKSKLVDAMKADYHRRHYATASSTGNQGVEKVEQAERIVEDLIERVQRNSRPR